MAEPLRAVAVNPLPWIAGGETTLLRLMPGLTERGWRMSATVPSRGRFGDALEAAGVPLRRLPLGPPERRTAGAYAGALAAPAVLRGQHLCLLNGLSTQRAVPGLRLLRTPAVLLVNNPLEQPPRAWATRRHWETVRAIAAASDHVAAECRAAGAPADLVHTAYPAAWAGPEPPGTAAPPPSGQHVGFVGQIEPRKGVLELIEAAATFLAGRPDARLTIVGEAAGAGDDYADRVRDAAAALDRVRLAGFRADAAGAMTDFDLVVVPSLAEPYGTVSAEAAGAGRPAVITAVGGMAEVVLDGVTGLQVPPGDPAALAAAVGSLLDAPERMRAMGAAALEHAGRFAPETYAATMDQLMRVAVAR